MTIIMKRLWAILQFVYIFSVVASNQVDEKSFPSRDSRAVVFYKVPPAACTARWGNLLFEGYCDTIPSCMVNGGMKVGVCPKGPICCLATAICGRTFSSQTGYFLNEDYAVASSTSATSPYCEVKLRKYESKTCQVRLDFEEFDIDEPDEKGECVEGFLEVVGTDPNFKVPKICGENSEQHMYLNYPSFGGEISLRVKTTNAKWKIKITQISCNPGDTPSTVPAGCLQYYSDSSATIKSFNFGAETPRQLNDLDYDICVEKASVSCIITWTFISFDVSGQQKTNLDNNGCPTTGSTCVAEGNYIEILGGTRNPVLVGCFDRSNRVNNIYCGKAVSTPTVTTTTAASSSSTTILKSAGSLLATTTAEATEFQVASPYPRLRVVTSPTDASPGTGFLASYKKSC